MPGSNLPLATLGTFLLWFGWFGFNGGSQLAMGSAADVNDISNIYINTNLAAAGGVVVRVVPGGASGSAGTPAEIRPDDDGACRGRRMWRRV